MRDSRLMGEVMRNGLSLWRWNRWFRVRVVGRWRLRKLWPSPADIDRMSVDEREAWFRSIGLDELIAAAKADYAREAEQDPALPALPVAQARPARRRDASQA